LEAVDNHKTWRNDFVGNNSQMSVERPKPANSNTRRTVYA